MSVLGVDAELDRYIQEATDVNCDCGLSFWLQRENSYPLLAPVAEDLVSAPSSQAYVDCGACFLGVWWHMHT